MPEYHSFAPGKHLSAVSSSVTSSNSQWNRDHPYAARLLRKRTLTTANAVKQVVHVELDLGDSGLCYQPGDTVALRVENDPALVQEILALCGLASDTVLAQALLQEHEITQVHPGFFRHYAAFCTSVPLQQLVNDSKLLRVYMEHKQIVDVVRDFPASPTAEQLRSCLRRLQERQYSIASSQNQTPTSVALTVGMVQFDSNGHVRHGAGSGFLSERVTAGTPLLIHIVSNPNFRLPADPDTPIIMIGPGTGIAPFRAFLQERQCQHGAGRNWLFAGNRRRRDDFLYGDELTTWQRSGLLTHLDVAFSRDQPEKIHVQHLLLQQAPEVYVWLQQGAHLYVCGDARHMAEDVQKTLLGLLEQQGGLTAEAARQYLLGLRQQHRYQRDVY
jgi:sulfite reductase (NADPH) flavoprotein alpha-component